MQGRLIRLCLDETLRMIFLVLAREVKKNSGYPRTNKARVPSVKLDKELTLPIESSNASLKNRNNSSRKSSTQRELGQC